MRNVNELFNAYIKSSPCRNARAIVYHINCYKIIRIECHNISNLVVF